MTENTRPEQHNMHNEQAVTDEYAHLYQVPAPQQQESGSFKHTIVALLGLPAFFIVLAVISGIATSILLALTPGLFDSVMSGDPEESVNALLQNSLFMNTMLILQSIMMVVTAFVAVMIVSGKKAFTLGSEGMFGKLGIPTTWNKKIYKTAAIGALIGVLLVGALQLVGMALNSMGYTIGSSETSEMIGASGSWFMLFFMVPIIVPIVEEIFFRGFIFGFLAEPKGKSTLRTVIALIVSSILFGLMHFQGAGGFSDWFVVIWTGLVGLVCGLMYWKTDSLIAPISVHIGYNGITALSIAITTF